MKFEDYTSCAPDYAKWLVSGNKAFFIGVLNYLLGQKCVQVLFKETAESQDQYVIREWRTYKPELVEKLIQEIKRNLTNVEAGFGDWGLVEKFLPEKTAKYLEDEPDEESLGKKENPFILKPLRIEGDPDWFKPGDEFEVIINPKLIIDTLERIARDEKDEEKS